MKTVNFTVTRVIVSSEKSFEEVTNSLDAINGKTDNAVFVKLITSNQSPEEVKSAIEAMVGQSGFMVFSQVEHGRLLSLSGKYKKAKLYVIGNPLIANQMFEHDTGVGLYVPLRLFVYDDYEGKTHIAYDKPSTQLGQFENEKILEIAQMLDQKFADMVAIATQ